MSQLMFIILLYWYHCSSKTVLCHFEVIEDKKIPMDYDSLQEYDEIQESKGKISKDSRHKKFPSDFLPAYPPSLTYLLWLKNNKRFPGWVYDMVRSKYHDVNLEWRVNELSRLYRKCDMITGGFPLSGIYIRHLLELINLQKRIDDHTIIQDINTKQDLEYLRSLHLPKAKNSTIRLRLRDEDEIYKKVDPIGYLKSLAMRSPQVRNILYKKYLSIHQDNSSAVGGKVFRDTLKQKKRIRNRLHRRNATTKRSTHKLMSTTESRTEPIVALKHYEPIITMKNYDPISKMQNVIDLIEDPGLNISKYLRKELRLVCKDYLNSYLTETCNLTNILKQFLELKQLTDDIEYDKLLDSGWNQTIDRLETEDKEIGIKLSDYFGNKNKKVRKLSKNISNGVIINRNTDEIKNKNITLGDRMYNELKFKSNDEDEKKKRYKFDKLTGFIENTKLYKKIKKEFSDNNDLSKYDLVDVLENIGYLLPKQAKKDLTYLYGELLKSRQRAKVKELFNEQNVRLCFPNMKYEETIDMLTSLMLSNINVKCKKGKPKLANVLETLGFNMTKSAKKKLNKLYFLKIKSNSRNGKQHRTNFSLTSCLPK